MEAFSSRSRFLIAVSIFSVISLFGLIVSYTSPYTAKDDELVYLAGAREAAYGDLPNGYMLSSYEQGPYLYPKLMFWFYEPMGYLLFKSVCLVALIFATGIAVYLMFRLLHLPWIPSLLLSVAALMPRFSSGLESFGVLTFKETTGRAFALPVFFLATGVIVRRIIAHKSLWPVFAALGFLVFLHPVSIMLFAFIALVSSAATLLWEKVSISTVVKEFLMSGVAFVLAASYFFVEVLKRLSQSTGETSVSSAEYVQAVLFRNPWEFPSASVAWLPHMFIVSAFFIAIIIVPFLWPRLKGILERFVVPHSRTLFIWGISITIGSMAISFLFPWANLLAMEHLDAPYVFQQWSRISKFYYLGLFVACIPMFYALWNWFIEIRTKKAIVIAALFAVLIIVSSSFWFEVVQFIVGYKNFEKAYIPQRFSSLPDDTAEKDYQAVCRALRGFGATPGDLIISANFGFRYYCKANLYSTFEDGAAYFQKPRADLVRWYNQYTNQRDALSSGSTDGIVSFSKNVGASFIVVPNIAKYKLLLGTPHILATSTDRFIVGKIRN